MPNTARDSSRRAFLAAAAGVGLVGLGPLSAAWAGGGGEKRAVRRLFKDVSRALHSGNAALFLSHFDRERFPDYGALAENVAALTAQSELRSSIEILEIAERDEGCAADIDWILNARLTGFGAALERRRERVRARVERVKGKWKITELEPLELFRPQSGL